jgi:hypothetical protein
VETELDLGDHSEWIMVERDPSLCELHKKSRVFVPLILIYFLFLFKVVLA